MLWLPSRDYMLKRLAVATLLAKQKSMEVAGTLIHTTGTVFYAASVLMLLLLFLHISSYCESILYLCIPGFRVVC